MRNSAGTNLLSASSAARVSAIDKLCRSLILRKFQSLDRGEVIIRDELGVSKFGSPDKLPSPLSTEIEVSDIRFYRAILERGSVGAGESFVKGQWECSDLTALIRIFVLNQSTMNKFEKGVALLSHPIRKLYHTFRRNTIDGAKLNISAHYDLGNEFFKLFLDPTMMYSAGIFTREDQTMEEASINKLKRICDKLGLTSDDHILEIGTGWGGFAIYAAKHYGCKVTTTTISREQFSYAKKQIYREKLEGLIHLKFQDYRKLKGRYDKIVSIEMIEAVGWQFYDQFHQACSRLLKENGSMLIQAITIQDQEYERAKREVDFIKQYVFPGCCIPSMTALVDSATRSSDLRLFHMEDNTINYARTLRKWYEKLLDNRGKILKMGKTEEFLRLWEFYLCYCEGGFRERSIQSVQYIMTKPGNRENPILPPLQ